MNDMGYFKRFIPKKEEEEKNSSVWLYTRVSTKDQYENNNSIERQLETSRRYATKNNFEITDEFGGTYESASSDFTRKEFKRLIDKVRSSRKRPFAILVYKISRFSRSGGGAIGLVHELVEELGVNLIEASSGISTTTERGKAAIYEKLFDAFKENLEKKELVIPSMQALLLQGVWMAKAPIGYTQYGPRVRDEKRLRSKQQIIVNSDGELLREAWKWKVSGLFSDAQIIARLNARGLHITKQKISQMWRNPFYCAIIASRMLDEAVPGNWEPLVSSEDFIRVQRILENNPSGFQQNKEEIMRPLTRLLKCERCSNYLVGYEVKSKGFHYYRCLKCRGVSVNAHTTKRSLRVGANELFIDYLKQYRIPKALSPLIKQQLTKLFEYHDNGMAQNDQQLKTQKATIEAKLKNLKIRHGLGEIDKETFDLTFDHLNAELGIISREENSLAPKISNLAKLIDFSFDTLENLSEIWVSSDLEGKRRVQKTLFPDGIYYNVEKHEYLTKKMNGFISLTSQLARDFTENKNGIFQDDPEKSRLAPPAGLEPATL